MSSAMAVGLVGDPSRALQNYATWRREENSKKYRWNFLYPRRASPE